MMRGFAYTVLAVVFLANLIQPLTEMVESCRQKILISSALHNSFRAARDRSLEEESMAEMDAAVDIDKFYEYFSDALCDSLDLYETESSVEAYGYITFQSYNESFNPIKVEVSIDDWGSSYDKDTVTVELHVETDYKFKVGYMKMLEDHTKYDPYTLEFDRSYVLLVRN